MSGILSGLEKFGLGNLENIDIYKEKEKEKENTPKEDDIGGVAVEVSEESVLFDKTYKCPCCSSNFKAKAIKVGRNTLVRLDSDLRPIYKYTDATKYDAIVCSKCGYAGLIKNFDSIGDRYIKDIREKITAKFKGIDESKKTYSYEDAIERTQLALLSTIIKCGRNSEKAYICLKLAWLTRGMKETLDKEAPDYAAKYEKLEKEEMNYLKNAYDGFSDAYMNEKFPICGMDENTLCIIMADTGRKFGKKHDSLRYLETVIMSKNASDRMKDMARKIREVCKEQDKI